MTRVAPRPETAREFSSTGEFHENVKNHDNEVFMWNESYGNFFRLSFNFPFSEHFIITSHLFHN